MTHQSGLPLGNLTFLHIHMFTWTHQLHSAAFLAQRNTKESARSKMSNEKNPGVPMPSCRDSSSNIKEISARFPGFRFSPTDTELVSHFLKRKTIGLDLGGNVISEVEFCKYEPWDLPEKSIISSDHEWFFFSPSGKKYPKGSQAKRGTESGYWKATGKEHDIKSGKKVIGTKRTLVFHLGRAPKGTRTCWMMNEYCLKEHKDDNCLSQDSYVICRLRKKQVSGSNVGLSPQSSDVQYTSDVWNGMQHLEMDDTSKSPEDDCFADVLKDDIIKLEDNSFLESGAHSSQGTAYRRIRLGRPRFRRMSGKMYRIGDKHLRKLTNRDGVCMSKYLTFAQKLFLRCERWRLSTVFVMMVLIFILVLLFCA